MDDLVKITVQTGHMEAGVKLTAEKFSEIFFWKFKKEYRFINKFVKLWYLKM